jgi:hypothetical protein
MRVKLCVDTLLLCCDGWGGGGWKWLRSLLKKGWLNATDIEHFNGCNFSSLYFSFLKRAYRESKAHPWTCPEVPEEKHWYISTLSLTLSLDGVGGQRHAPATLLPEKTRYPLCGRLGGPQDRFGRVRKISPPPGFDPQTVQPVASRYTD